MTYLNWYRIQAVEGAPRPFLVVWLTNSDTYPNNRLNDEPSNAYSDGTKYNPSRRTMNKNNYIHFVITL